MKHIIRDYQWELKPISGLFLKYLVPFKLGCRVKINHSLAKKIWK
jgi:hypothetical protein